jgi:hypothetical protein
MKYLSRRMFLGHTVKAAVAAPFVLRRSYRVFAQPSKEYPERVVRLMRESLVIDMLNPFLYREDKQDPHFQKNACKLFGMTSSKRLSLKPFRMSIYRKTGRGEAPRVGRTRQSR